MIAQDTAPLVFPVLSGFTPSSHPGLSSTLSLEVRYTSRPPRLFNEFKLSSVKGLGALLIAVKFKVGLVFVSCEPMSEGRYGADE